MKIFHSPLAVSMGVAGDTRVAHSLLCNCCTGKTSGDGRSEWLLDNTASTGAKGCSATAGEEACDVESFPAVRERTLIDW